MLFVCVVCLCCLFVLFVCVVCVVCCLFACLLACLLVDIDTGGRRRRSSSAGQSPISPFATEHRSTSKPSSHESTTVPKLDSLFSQSSATNLTPQTSVENVAKIQSPPKSIEQIQITPQTQRIQARSPVSPRSQTQAKSQPQSQSQPQQSQQSRVPNTVASSISPNVTAEPQIPSLKSSKAAQKPSSPRSQQSNSKHQSTAATTAPLSTTKNSKDIDEKRPQHILPGGFDSVVGLAKNLPKTDEKIPTVPKPLTFQQVVPFLLLLIRVSVSCHC